MATVRIPTPLRKLTNNVRRPRNRPNSKPSPAMPNATASFTPRSSPVRPLWSTTLGGAYCKVMALANLR